MYMYIYIHVYITPFAVLCRVLTGGVRRLRSWLRVPRQGPPFHSVCVLPVFPRQKVTMPVVLSKTATLWDRIPSRGGRKWFILRLASERLLRESDKRSPCHLSSTGRRTHGWPGGCADCGVNSGFHVRARHSLACAFSVGLNKIFFHLFVCMHESFILHCPQPSALPTLLQYHFTTFAQYKNPPPTFP